MQWKRNKIHDNRLFRQRQATTTIKKVKKNVFKLEAICTGDATTIPLSEKLPVRCRVKIQVNEAVIQIIVGRYKKKKMIRLFIATFSFVFTSSDDYGKLK